MKTHMYLSAWMLLVCLFQARAQDPEFTQFFAAPVYINPAFAGAAVEGRVTLNYRNQWPPLPGTFRTFAGSYDEQHDKLGGGLGLMAMQDKAGDGLLTTTTFSGVYSYLIPVSRYFNIRAGIEAQYFQRSIEFDKLKFGDQIVPKKGFVKPTAEPNPNRSIGIPNFAAGFLGYTERFYVGLAIHNLTEPNQSFYKTPGSNLPRRYTVHGGTTIRLGKNGSMQTAICPNVLLMKQQEFTQVNLGFYLNHGPLITGLWFRQTGTNPDAAVVLAGFQKDRFRFCYSYDLTVSSGRQAMQGAHEISAAIQWRKPYHKKKYGELQCPMQGMYWRR